MQSTIIPHASSQFTRRQPALSSHKHRQLPPCLRSSPSIQASGNNEGEANDAVSNNPLFNSQFMGVLQQSLARSGPDALTSGGPRAEESRTSAVEEVLGNALVQSKRTLAMLQQWRNQIDAQIAAQEKQVDRMEFALNKSRSDAAYMKALKDMLYNSGGE